MPFDVEVIEDAGAAPARYRDAVRLADGDALLVMTDLADGATPDPTALARWKERARQAGAKGKGPDAVLKLMNQELFEAGLQAVATCARLHAQERLVKVACAGTAPPFVVRSGLRIARAQAMPTVALGRVRNAQYAERSLHFDRGDTLLIPSVSWMASLEPLLAGPAVVSDLPIGEWLRARVEKPPGGSLLCLSMR
jgi:hypothetical protein